MTDRPILTTKPPVQYQRLKIYLRSGNALMIDGVIGWSMTHREGRTVSLNLTQSTDPQFARVVVESIDLSQIEAVVVLPTDGARRAARESE